MDKKEQNTKGLKIDKKILIAIIAVIVVIIVVVAVVLRTRDNNKKDVVENEDGTTAITEQGVIKDESYGGLNFSNTTLIKDGNMYTLSMDVTNSTDETIDLEQVGIDMKNDKGNVLITLNGYIGEPMAAGETRTITSSTETDLSKVTSKTIVEYKQG